MVEPEDVSKPDPLSGEVLKDYKVSHIGRGKGNIMVNYLHVTLDRPLLL